MFHLREIALLNSTCSSWSSGSSMSPLDFLAKVTLVVIFCGKDYQVMICLNDFHFYIFESILEIMLVIVGAFCAAIVVALYLWISAGKPKYTVDGNKRIVTSCASTPYFFSMAIMKSMFHKKRKNVQLTGISFSQAGMTIDPERVKKYRKNCGFKEGDEVPLTYPYLMIFPLQGLLLVDKAFCFPAMGIVHLANRIQQYGVLTAGSAKYTASSRLDENLLPHAKGYCFVVISEVHSDAGVLLWRCESTYLYRAKVSASAVSGATPVYESKIKTEYMDGCKEVKPYKLPAGFGLKYAAISGDFNPIHCYAITAKLFGFPHGAIMHGMWSNGACVADIMPDLSSLKASSASGREAIAEVYVELKMPMYLPANAVLECKEDNITPPNLTSDVPLTHKNKRLFQIMMKGKKGGEMVPHLRGTCSWK